MTNNGSTFTGDFLVGTDGVHSSMRQEIWCLANSTEPGHIPKYEVTGNITLLLTGVTYLIRLAKYSHAL